MARTSFTLHWDAHTYEHKERSQDWFWAVGIVTAAVAVACVIFGDVIFGILILLSAFSLSLFINRPPETTHVEVDEHGITKGHIRYPYSTLHSFWIDIERPHPTILLRSQKLLMPLIHIPLGPDTDIDRLEKILLQRLPEEFFGHHLTERILEYFGF